MNGTRLVKRRLGSLMLQLLAATPGTPVLKPGVLAVTMARVLRDILWVMVELLVVDAASEYPSSQLCHY